MDIKEAREIKEKLERLISSDVLTPTEQLKSDYPVAIGYLKAIEKAGVLVEALQHMKEPCQCKQAPNCCYCCGWVKDKAEKTLAQFEKEA